MMYVFHYVHGLVIFRGDRYHARYFAKLQTRRRLNDDQFDLFIDLVASITISALLAVAIVATVAFCLGR